MGVMHHFLYSFVQLSSTVRHPYFLYFFVQLCSLITLVYSQKSYFLITHMLSLNILILQGLDDIVVVVVECMHILGAKRLHC
jgi:hypothetical protein